MSDTSLPVIEPELRGFLETLSQDVQSFNIVNGDISGMRRASASARMRWQSGGPGVVSEMLEASGMAVRLFRPPGVLRPPVLIYLHGGGWCLLSVQTHDRLLREYAAASGWAVIAPDYPLSPEARYPAALVACTQLVDEIRKRAAPLGLDREHIVIGGDSSGANLALGVALGGAAGRLCGLLLNYGVLDSDLSRPSYARFGGPPYLLNAAKMSFFWNAYCPEPRNRLTSLAAPLRASDTELGRLPSCCMVIAGQDVLADENDTMAIRLEAVGVDLRVLRFPNATHAFLEAIAVSPSARAAVKSTAAWLAEIARTG